MISHIFKTIVMFSLLLSCRSIKKTSDPEPLMVHPLQKDYWLISLLMLRIVGIQVVMKAVVPLKGMSLSLMAKRGNAFCLTAGAIMQIQEEDIIYLIGLQFCGINPDEISRSDAAILAKYDTSRYEPYDFYLNLDVEETIPSMTIRNDLVTIGRQALLFTENGSLEFKGKIDELKNTVVLQIMRK